MKDEEKEAKTKEEEEEMKEEEEAETKELKKVVRWGDDVSHAIAVVPVMASPVADADADADAD